MVRISNANGSYLYDSDGKEYINLSESINILGHRNPELVEIISDRISDNFIHYPLPVSYPEVADFVKKEISSLSGIGNGAGIYTSSGSEACDVALSILSEFGPVITVEGGYPGNTGQFLRKSEMDLLLYKNSFEIPFPKTDKVMENVEKCVKNGAKSIFIEPLQVEGGIREVYHDFFKDLLDRYPELLICIDESYTGFGKTGKMFSYQWFDFVPDMLITGKAIGGGFPLGLTLMNSKIAEKSSRVKVFRNHAFGSTSGNITSLYLAQFIIKKVSSADFLEEVTKKGDMFTEALGPYLEDRIRGRGLVRGIVFENEMTARHYSDLLIKNGVLATTMSNAIRISPPLTIPVPVLKEAIKKIKKIIL